METVDQEVDRTMADCYARWPGRFAHSYEEYCATLRPLSMLLCSLGRRDPAALDRLVGLWEQEDRRLFEQEKRDVIAGVDAFFRSGGREA